MTDTGVVKGPDGTIYKTVFTSSTFGEIAEKYNSLITNHGAESELNDILAQYSTLPPFVSNFFRAKFAASSNNYANAAKYMDLVIEEIESADQDVHTFLFFNSFLLKDIYGNAGEIYANNDNNDKALRYYQDYEITLSQIKSCDFSEGLLSFRPFTAYSLSDLVNNEITVCSPRVMNDPYDTLLIKWGENIRLIKGGKKHVDSLCKSFESYRIRSFCRLKDKDGNDSISNVLMWAHYAKNHTGFCIEYNFSDKFPITESRRVSRFKDINYHKRDVPFDMNTPSINTDQALCTKLSDWAYENEVRLITYVPDKEGYYLAIPLDEDSSITAIYFGYRCPEETVKTIKNALAIHAEIQYYKMISDYNDIYRLKAIPIE